MSTFGLTLDTVKAFLGYDIGSPSNTSRDVILQLWLDSAVEIAKKLTGRNLEYGWYRDTFGYRREGMYLQEFPIASMISVTVGNSVLTPDTDYQVFLATGRIEFKHHWHCGREPRHMGAHPLVIEYVGGYTVLPAIVQMAILAGIQAAEQAHVQATTYGGTVKQLTVVDVGTTAFLTRKDWTSAALSQTMNEQLTDFLSNIPVLGAHLLQESEYLGEAPGSPL